MNIFEKMSFKSHVLRNVFYYCGFKYYSKHILFFLHKTLIIFKGARYAFEDFEKKKKLQLKIRQKCRKKHDFFNVSIFFIILQNTSIIVNV